MKDSKYKSDLLLGTVSVLVFGFTGAYGSLIGFWGLNPPLFVLIYALVVGVLVAIALIPLVLILLEGQWDWRICFGLGFVAVVSSVIGGMMVGEAFSVIIISMAVIAVAGAIRLFRMLILQLRTKAGRCESCGYDLRGITSQHCPECGRERPGNLDK